MGWKCNKCKNTESFTEINPVETLVFQEKGTTKVLKIENKYRKGNEGALNVWCNKCESEDVSWVEVPTQDFSYFKESLLKNKE